MRTQFHKVYNFVFPLSNAAIEVRLGSSCLLHLTLSLELQTSNFLVTIIVQVSAKCLDD